MPKVNLCEIVDDEPVCGDPERYFMCYYQNYSFGSDKCGFKREHYCTCQSAQNNAIMYALHDRETVTLLVHGGGAVRVGNLNAEIREIECKVVE